MQRYNRFRLPKDGKKSYLPAAAVTSLCLEFFPWGTFRKAREIVEDREIGLKGIIGTHDNK
ncbi:MAG: hypothetical protein VB050_07015 [Geobacteraceae bacterium]|nr:hypothetical protein [Geobacteraceae bacterium]